MALAHDIKERIFAAADELHSKSPTGEFPSVEAVRQESRAGMNNVVEAMKEWRQNQRKQVQAVREPLPAELHSTVQTMGQSFWEVAQQLANESLDAAKVAFENEKSDLLQLSKEQSEAFEKQALELEAVHGAVSTLNEQVDAAKAAAQATAQELLETQRALLAAEQTAALATQRAEEIERRAGELRTELDHAHNEAEQRVAELRAELEQVRAEADRLRTERDKAQQRHESAEAGRDKARAEAATAREEAASLRGELEATKTQNIGLLAALKPSPTPKRRTTPPKN